MNTKRSTLAASLLALSALAGCVQAGSEGPTSTRLHPAGSLSDRRDALRTVRVVDKAPAGSASLDGISVRRCHRNFLEDAPDAQAIVDDLKLAAYAQGADAIRPMGTEKVNGVMANCWYVLEGKAEMYRLGRSGG